MSENGIRAGGWGRVWLLALVLVAAAVVAEMPAVRGDFQWDDEELHIAKAASVDLPWQFFRLRSEGSARQAQGNYYPLSMVVFWGEYQVFGRETRGYHVVNFLLHAGNVVLAWGLLRRLKVPWAWTIALMFAIHPMVVESVAYISELKNLLSGMFYLAGGHFWLTWSESPKRNAWYGAVVGCFVAAMLAKSVACTFPAAMLLVEYWRAGRLDRRAVIAAIPLFAIGAVMAVGFVLTEQGRVGAQGAEFHFTIVERVLIAGRALWFYTGKLVWPWPLLTVYPRWEIDIGAWWQYLYVIGAVVVGVGLWVARGWIGRGPVAAGMLFVVIVAPSLGLVVYYPMLFTYVADHYLYLGMVPLAALYLGVIRCVLRRVRGAEVIVAAVLGLILLPMTLYQASRWQTQVSLWEATAERNPRSWYVAANLAYACIEAGRFEEAQHWAEASLALKEDNSRAHFTLARAELESGQMDAAVGEYARGLALEPTNAVARSNDGYALERLGRLAEAEQTYVKSLELDGSQFKVWNEVAALRLRRGAWEEATSAARRAIENSPEYGAAYINLGLALEKEGKFGESIEALEGGLKRIPPNARVEEELAQVRQMQASEPAASEPIKH